MGEASAQAGAEAWADAPTARWWHATDDGRLECDLCPRRCRLRPGQRGFCFVRARDGDRMVLTTYGRSSGFAVDPIEKKPLAHFHPGTSVLSFGTAGCNLNCRFCQNWDISKSREWDRLAAPATPDAIADAAASAGCESVAFTYNDPVIFAEYAIDTARACRDRGLNAVAVTAGYITPEARADFFAPMDAANIDLKGFTEDFYWKITGAHLDDVLDTIAWVHENTETWIELTTLLIPGHNDAPDDIDRMCRWILAELGPDVPLHFSAFHPDFKMLDVPPTPPATLRARARRRARRGHAVRLHGQHARPRRRGHRVPGVRRRAHRARLVRDRRLPAYRGRAVPGVRRVPPRAIRTRGRHVGKAKPPRHHRLTARATPGRGSRARATRARRTRSPCTPGSGSRPRRAWRGRPPPSRFRRRP